MRLLDTLRLVNRVFLSLVFFFLTAFASIPSISSVSSFSSLAPLASAEATNSAANSTVPITGNGAVDETFRGIERASGWTDRALMLGMLVIVLFMCGYFLKMANDEIKRQRTISQDEAAKFLETSRESVKVLAINSTALNDASRQMEQNRAIAERVLRTLERVEAELVKFERGGGYGGRQSPRRES